MISAPVRPLAEAIRRSPPTTARQARAKKISAVRDTQSEYRVHAGKKRLTDDEKGPGEE
jgi:hypothetical protein